MGFKSIGSMGCNLILATTEDQDLNEPLRIATSYPGLTAELVPAQGYQVENIQAFGGKIEAKLTNPSYNAVVDIVETGETLRANGGIVRDVLIEDLESGIVFRREPIQVGATDFEPWRLLRVMATIARRKQELDAGADPGTKKSTLLLLADQNRLVKTIGEESAELIQALVTEDGTVGEAADLFWATMVALTREGQSPLLMFEELGRRNQQSKQKLNEK